MPRTRFEWRSIGAAPLPARSRAKAITRHAASIVVPAIAVTLLWLWGYVIAAGVVAGIAIVLVGGSLASKRMRAVVEKVGSALGRYVGAAISYIVLVALYVTILLPASLVLRLLGRTPLQLAPDPARGTYWDRIAVHAPPRLYRRTFALEQPTLTHHTRTWWRTLFVRLFAAYAIICALIVTNYIVGILVLHETPPATDGRVPADKVIAMKQYPWAKEWDNQFWKLRRSAAFHPMVLFRHEDMSHELVNIKSGIRKSYEPELGGKKPIVIQFFGGSTMLGQFQRDEHTISSEVARLAEARGIPVRVVNYGALGYTSINEIAQLVLNCAGNNRPDVAVFYDGWNDSMFALLAPVAPDSPPFRRGPYVKSAWPARDDFSFLEKYSYVHELLRDPPPPRPPRKKPSADAALKYLEKWYFGNLQLAQNLGRSYGFAVLTYYQPSYYTIAPNTREMSVADLTSVPSFWGPVQHEAMGELTRKLRPKLPSFVIDIGNALDSAPSPVMTDPIHTNEIGARLVAERMFVDLEPKLREIMRAREAQPAP